VPVVTGSVLAKGTALDFIHAPRAKFNRSLREQTAVGGGAAAAEQAGGGRAAARASSSSRSVFDFLNRTLSTTVANAHKRKDYSGAAADGGGSGGGGGGGGGRRNSGGGDGGGGAFTFASSSSTLQVQSFLRKPQVDDDDDDGGAAAGGRSANGEAAAKKPRVSSEADLRRRLLSLESERKAAELEVAKWTGSVQRNRKDAATASAFAERLRDAQNRLRSIVATERAVSASISKKSGDAKSLKF
jgi:hypothetical protein